ncbi:MAG: hypothetical protein IEMM0002_0815 [bacterium]|nr:MAG: hypothetical protein IEMM0002_0815 [bacterium]
MKLRKEIIHYLSKRIVDGLLEKEMIEFDAETDQIITMVEGSINSDLMVEERLNDEVKDILEEQEERLDEENINYRKMFQMVKNKLARERGIIL